MIRQFGDTETERVWLGHRSKKLQADIQHVARRKLRMINSAQNLNDLRIPPANRLEKLKGLWIGFHSIRINDQWRIVFRWLKNDAYDVKITDYH